MRKSVVLIGTSILFLLLVISILSYTIISFEKENSSGSTAHLEIGIDLAEYMEDYDIQVNITNTGNSSFKIDDEDPAMININVSRMDGIVIWSDTSKVSLVGTESIEPEGFITHHFYLNTEWNMINRTTSLPYGHYLLKVEVITAEESYRNSTGFNHTPLVDMEISGETVDGKGLAIVSYTNTRDYSLNFSISSPPLTFIDIYDVEDRRIGGSGDGYIQVVVEYNIHPGRTIYSNITFINDYWHDKLTSGTYRIEASCMAFPIHVEEWVFFEGYELKE